MSLRKGMGIKGCPRRRDDGFFSRRPGPR